jgi:predicted DNA-binding protein with PD1-like motif
MSEGAIKKMKPHAVRFLPGQDLKKELNAFALKLKIRAGFVVSCCGSLKVLKMRLADSNSIFERKEKFEILSLQGTLSPDGAHLHINVADKDGKTWGGHLVEGCEIYTTAEILIAELPGVEFSRVQDSQTGFAELLIQST